MGRGGWASGLPGARTQSDIGEAVKTVLVLLPVGCGSKALVGGQVLGPSEHSVPASGTKSLKKCDVGGIRGEVKGAASDCEGHRAWDGDGLVQMRLELCGGQRPLLLVVGLEILTVPVSEWGGPRDPSRRPAS